ncbi:MAG TPA: serine hydrolase domain-containing protein [Pseudonocardiaceae bacterium]|nr:serine hydrolase domain-containing protein [Pseudonocardiaceae bacterium]
MSDQSRALPDQPNLRFLKIEAKRRLAAGEFPTLHDAQLAIAREHGLSSWTALKQAISVHHVALPQVRWVVDRFRDADTPAWAPPDDDELRAHFTDRLLDRVPVDTLITTLRGVSARLRAGVVMDRANGSRLRAHVANLRIEAAAEPEPPHRLTALRMYPIGSSDDRTANPTTVISGDAPAGAVDVVEKSFAELGLPGIVAAGALWTVARGWADLDRGEELRPDHRFPVYGVTSLITSTAVLRLVADGRVELDQPVREVLTHAAGAVADPGSQGRGTLVPSSAGFDMLGRLIAEVTGSSYAEAVADLVLRPLGMTESSFPSTWPDSLTGYHLTADGTFEPVARQVSAGPAAAGMWTTARDLVRFGRSWSTLLPAELAAEAVRPQVSQPTPGAAVGFGWLVNAAQGAYGYQSVGQGAAVSLIVRGEVVTVVATNRMVPIEPVNARLSRMDDQRR